MPANRAATAPAYATLACFKRRTTSPSRSANPAHDSATTRRTLSYQHWEAQSPG